MRGSTKRLKHTNDLTDIERVGNRLKGIGHLHSWTRGYDGPHKGKKDVCEKAGGCDEMALRAFTRIATRLILLERMEQRRKDLEHMQRV